MRDAMDVPLVAIVTPVYNGGAFLRQAMESVQRQTYPAIVHVLCNNSSTDDTATIIKEFRSRRVRLLVIETDELLPLADNWNKAFLAVPPEARYAKLLCADDLIRNDAIEKLVALAESNREVEVVLSQDVFADEVRRARLPTNRSVFDGRELARQVLSNRIGWLAYHHFFVRLRPLDRENRFVERYWSPDPHIVLRSAIRGKFGYIDEPLAYNRIHPDSVTGRELTGKGVQFALVGMHLHERFGAAVFGRRERVRKLDAYLVGCSRSIIRWSLTGHRARARDLLAGLKEGGLVPRLRHYVSAVLGWPIASVSWRLHDDAPRRPMDEAAFTAVLT